MIDEVFLQHDDDEVLHSMIFYNKSFNFVEINYHIYNKKLLIIHRQNRKVAQIDSECSESLNRD